MSSALFRMLLVYIRGYLKFRVPIIWPLCLREEGCEDAWIVYEAKRGPRAKEFGETLYKMDGLSQ